MSIPVELDALEDATADYGWAYLLTVTDDQRTKILAVEPEWQGTTLVASVGRGTARNAEARSQVTLAYPPSDPSGYTLIVDGLARVSTTDDGATVTIAPSGAVLHRPAAEGFVNGATGCSNDCAPVT